MVVVAVAGGTGNVGRAIVDAILATGRHEVKILSRKTNPDLEAEIGATIIAVDYSDVESVAEVLDKHQVHTVVSGIAMHSVDGTTPKEIELIRACDLAKSTKRLISSEWGTPLPDTEGVRIPSQPYKAAAKEELKKTKSLEYTLFYNGYFMDYWGLPKVSSYLARAPLVFWLDIANNAAALPGSGNVPAVFTHTTDVARFVAASLDRPSWEPETFVYGDRVTWNEFLHLAEEAKGVKFNVVYDDVGKLKAKEASELPSLIPLYQILPKPMLLGYAASFGLWFEEGVFDLKPSTGGFLNEVFPEIKPMKVKEILDKAWKKV